MKWSIILDFDGTITKFDVGDFLLLKFGLVSKDEIENSYNFGMRVEEWMRIYFSRMRNIGFDKIKEVLRNEVILRDGFKEMVELIREKGFVVEVVSGGVDLYIEEIFRMNNVNINGFYGRFNGGDIRYDFLGGGMTLSEFKKFRVVHYKNLGYKTIFCGDSPNDYEASRESDICFATLRLKDILKKEGYSFNELNDFYSVIRIIDASNTN
jgi:HAD superfamily phosphoserine phosphatase-like hydrolase